MICVVIRGPTFDEAYQHLSQLSQDVDMVELRLDLFDRLDLSELQRLQNSFSIPMIFTLRSQCHGGYYQKSEDERLAEIRDLVQLKPDFLDLENDVPTTFIQEISTQYPSIKLILSHHNFSETPNDLDALFARMQKTPVSYYKIALMANNCLDAMRLLFWVKNKNHGKIISISMGSHGQISRILSPVIECPFSYAIPDGENEIAPGQISVKKLIEGYHFNTLNHQTAVYGLIGDPVTSSISDITHNMFMKEFGYQGVYVKIQVLKNELRDFLRYAKQFSFRGLSVTMPLKEEVLKYIDHIDPQALEIGAVNTLVFEEGQILGFNTDGIGALNAIEQIETVESKRIIILGAGGAARAIAHEALRRGGIVTILNRNHHKVLQVSRDLKCRGLALEEMKACFEEGYDVLINCTPVGLPISSDHIVSQTIVMDITTMPKETELIQLASHKGCRIVYGYQMFIEQALGQFQLWFSRDSDDISNWRALLEKRALELLLV